MSKEVFIAIGMRRGIVERTSVHEMERSAREAAVKFAQLDGYDFEDYIRMSYAQAKEDLNGFEWFTTASTQSDSDYSLYPYRYRDRFLTLYETQEELVMDGYLVVEEMDELEFSQYIFDRQEGSGQVPVIQFLEQRFELEYRGNEQEKTLYALNEKQALDKACEWNHHAEYWRIADA